MPSSILGGSSIQHVWYENSIAVLTSYSYHTSIQHSYDTSTHHSYYTSIQHTRTHTAIDHLQNAPSEVEAQKL